MRRRSSILLLALFLCAVVSCKSKKTAPAAPAPAPEPEAKVEVLLLPSQVDAVDFRILFLTGSVDDPAGKEGLTALTAELMAQGGTAGHDYPELLDLFYPMATEVDVQVDREMTVFTARVHRDHLDGFIPLLADVVTRPRFDAAAFTRLRTDAINSIEKGLRMTDDEQLGIQALDVWIHEGHPYGHLVEGTVHGLSFITLEDVKGHWGRVFTRDRLVVGMAGAVDEALASRMREAFASLPEKGAPKAVIEAVEPRDGIHVRIIEKDTASTVITLGYPLDVGRDHEDYHALWLAQSALGEHRQSSGRLFSTIREKRGLNYGDYAYIEPYVDHGSTTKPTLNIARKQHTFNVWIRSVPSENRLFALRLAFFALDRFIREGITEDELGRSRGFLDGYTRVFEESLDRRLGYALDDLFHGAEEPYLEAARTGFAGLTLGEVNAAIGKHMRIEDLMVVIVTKDGEALKSQIASGAQAEVHYHTEKPAEVLEQDRSIVSFDAGLTKASIEVIPVEQVFEK